MTRWISVALGLLALGVFGCQTRTAPPPAAPVKPVASVKAGDLLNEYSTNAIAADGKYKGKVIQVSGKFGSVQKVPLMGYAVQLQTEDTGDVNLAGIQCFITQAAQDDVGKLQPGQIITLQGVCDGQVALGQIKLSKCTLAK
jgi:hypothetical protein